MVRDMTQGNVTRHLLTYAVPLMFANLLQQLYQTVDSIIVGQYNGKEALAAIGAAGPIMNILIFLIVGLSLGASILMSEYFGAKDYKALKTEMATSLVSGFILTIVLSLLAFTGSGLFIRMTRTPLEIAPMASQYLKIISLGLIFTFFYNILSAGLRSIGDSRAPLYVLCLTTILHVLLAVYMVGTLHMGVQGAAYATVISQAVSSLMLFIYIKVKVPYLRLSLPELHIDMDFLKKTVDFSSISALQQTVLYIGRLLVQSGINTLGVDAVAAFNAVSIIDSYVLAPGDSLAASITTFTAQNKGGKQYHRIPKGLKTVIVMAEILYNCHLRPCTGRKEPASRHLPETGRNRSAPVWHTLHHPDGLLLLPQRNHQQLSGIFPWHRKSESHTDCDNYPDPYPCYSDLLASGTFWHPGGCNRYYDWVVLYDGL